MRSSWILAVLLDCELDSLTQSCWNSLIVVVDVVVVVVVAAAVVVVVVVVAAAAVAAAVELVAAESAVGEVVESVSIVVAAEMEPRHESDSSKKQNKDTHLPFRDEVRFFD